MLGSPPVDPRLGNMRQKAVLAKLMEQHERQGRRRGALGSLRGGSPMTGRLTKFGRRSAIPRISRPPGLAARLIGEFGAGAQSAHFDLGVGGSPGEFEQSPDWGVEAPNPSSLAPKSIDPIQGDAMAQDTPLQSNLHTGLGYSDPAPGAWFQEALASGQQPYDAGVSSSNTVWIPLGNGLFYNPETENIRGGGLPVSGTTGGGVRKLLPV